MIGITDLAALALSVGFPLIFGGLLGSSIRKDVKGWYSRIRKPTWNPPNWLFGPVWGVLYTCMGFAAWLVWREGGLEVQKLPLGLYAAQLALNLAWTPIFFKAHRIKLALIDISALLVLVVLTASKFSTVIGLQTTVLLMGPYLLWSAFAAALTYSILALNLSAKAN
ncbi:MAG: hypothetical protein WDW38_007854 [Sanguina aurantia]